MLHPSVYRSAQALSYQSLFFPLHQQTTTYQMMNLNLRPPSGSHVETAAFVTLLVFIGVSRNRLMEHSRDVFCLEMFTVPEETFEVSPVLGTVQIFRVSKQQ
eukprot:GHVT01088629.1.p1 GENE.GHVT01088629.1~~GHVT01088629.1.p1  ORF type:complete len:102 (+),score=6.55 GHVT01088629.1:273-578(+)